MVELARFALAMPEATDLQSAGILIIRQLLYMVLVPEFESGCLSTGHFKCPAYTNFAIRAFNSFKFYNYKVDLIRSY